MLGRFTVPTQAFTGNPLDRTVLSTEAEGPEAKPTDKFLPVAGRTIYGQHDQGSANLLWLTADEVKQADLLGSANGTQPCETYLLGLDREGAMCYALDVSVLGRGAEAAVAGVRAGAAALDMRGALMTIGAEDSAVAGQAVALSQWHLAHPFCPRCGGATTAVQSGTRRQCTADASHRQYPRTDPVVIMLVESVDGSQALLGRSTKIRPGMMTTLAGFVDQCESIEEAVRREVLEEVGIRVGEVNIVGSQPWPIGRGGSCELMIGAVAKALHDDFAVNRVEMEDAKWYSRTELRQAVQGASDLQRHPYNTGDTPDLGFYVPPPIAIAHHIIKQWAESPVPRL